MHKVIHKQWNDASNAQWKNSEVKKSAILWTWVQDAVSYHYRVMRCLLKIYVLTWHCAALAQGRLWEVHPFFHTMLICKEPPCSLFWCPSHGGWESKMWLSLMLYWWCDGNVVYFFSWCAGMCVRACTCQLKCVWEFAMPWYVDWFLCIS